MLETARKALETEAEAIIRVRDMLDENFIRTIELIFACEQRVVVTGVGKSGLVCKKIAATLASTGTPAFFLHAGDAIHGDLGMIVRGDVVLSVSNSGESTEIIGLLPLIKRLGVKLICMTGKPESELGKAADVVLNIGVRSEACPLGLAPTASTTAALALGDAIAIVLLDRRGFKKEDFADLHPGGKLGQKLKRVCDLMITGNDVPVVTKDTLMKDAIVEMNSKGLGLTTVVDSSMNLTGLLTDGDLRRAVSSGSNMLNKPVKDFMTEKPKLIHKKMLAAEALRIMESHSITALLIVDSENRLEGVIKLQDIIREGII